MKMKGRISVRSHYNKSLLSKHNKAWKLGHLNDREKMIWLSLTEKLKQDKKDIST